MSGFLKLFGFKKKAHFLHIGKTGGSAIKYALAQAGRVSDYSIKVYHHGIMLKDVAVGDAVFFCLRDPVRRFISGFYSRQRKGRPKYRIEWSSEEEGIFARFKTPNELACSLGNPASSDHPLAVWAMNTLRHLEHYSTWYGDLEYFNSRIDDILFVGFQESLNEDFMVLKKLLGLPDSVQLPDGDVDAHKSPAGLDCRIAPCGLEALQDWYAEDIYFVQQCRDLMFKRQLR